MFYKEFDNFLSTVELEQMLQEAGMLLNEITPSQFENPWFKDNCAVIDGLQGHEGTGSGGFADHIFKYAARELFGEECSKLEYKDLRYGLYL